MTLTSRRPAPDGQQFIIIGEGYYGMGKTIEGALAQLVRVGGRARKSKYLVYLTGDRTTVNDDGSFGTKPNDDGSYSGQALLALVTGTNVVLDTLPPLELRS